MRDAKRAGGREMLVEVLEELLGLQRARRWERYCYILGREKVDRVDEPFDVV